MDGKITGLQGKNIFFAIVKAKLGNTIKDVYLIKRQVKKVYCF